MLGIGDGRLSQFSLKMVFSCNTTEKIRSGNFLSFRKLLVTKHFMHKREVSQFSVVIFRSENVDKNWDSKPYLPFQNPDVLATVPCQPSENLTNVSEII